MRGVLPIFIGFFDLYLVPIKSPGPSYTARVGWTRSGSCGAGALLFGRRQSIPSSNIESCAALIDTAPLCACGHTNLPSLKRLQKRHIPSPLCHSTFTLSP